MMLAPGDMAPDQPGALEDGQVFRNRCEADLERLGEGADGPRSVSQTAENGASRRVGESCKRVIEGRTMFNHTVKR